jgi:methyl-accepting chemotaxis protein/methyl-accepting chemotaxis protein-1 (serine sensor receptor)
LDEVSKAIANVTTETEKVKTLVDEVSFGSQEQAHGLEEITKSVEQMGEVTQKTAASAEESAAAGEELSAQSDALRQLVERLTLLVGGGAREGALASTPRQAKATPSSLKSEATKATPMATKGRDFPLDDDFQEI